MKRVLVTGATGFLGAHVVLALRGRDVEVVALCRGDARAIEGDGVQVEQGDVLDGERVREAAAGCDGAIHCAGKVSRDAEDAEALYACTSRGRARPRRVRGGRRRARRRRVHERDGRGERGRRPRRDRGRPDALSRS